LKDIQIISEILDGNKNRYSEIMEKYHKEVFKYTFNIIGDYQLTEDITQEVFFKIYQNLDRYDNSRASFRTWMYRITSNYVLNYIKSKKYKEFYQSVEINEDLIKSNDDIEDNIEKDEKIRQVLEVMNRILKPKHYQIMSLHFFSDLSVKEISKTMEIPEKTIYKAINSSIQKIKKEVDLDDEVE
jgi:RNA polymerase sigma-70 factor (ECF subfamily)